MNRATVSSLDESAVGHTLARPTTTARRLRGRLERLRLAWRRATIAVGAGLLAGAATAAWLSAAPPSRSEEGRSDTSTDDSLGAVEARDLLRPATPTDRRSLPDDQRILALDRSTIALPVSIGAVVEVVGLRPTVTDVQAEVISARADVVGVTDTAVLVALDAEAAYAAAEIAAVGRITILGRERPPD